MELQAEQQRDQNRAMLDQRAFEQKAQIEATQAQADVAATNTKMQADVQTNAQKAQADIAMNREKMAMEAEMEMRRFELEKQLKMMEFSLKMGLEKAKLIGVRRQDHDRSGNRQCQPDPIPAPSRRRSPSWTTSAIPQPVQEQRHADRMQVIDGAGHMLAQTMQQLAAAHMAPTANHP